MSRIGQGIRKSILTANSVLYAVTASVPAALSMTASRILGRKSSGNIAAMTVAELLTLIGVEAGATADLTGVEIVALLEALAGVAQLSHTKISDIGATDHHTAAILASLLTTKGDVIARSTVPVRIPVGANDEVLTADSAQTAGVKWAAAAGGAPTKELIVPAGPGATEANLRVKGDFQSILANAFHSFKVPHDFTTLVSAEVITTNSSTETLSVSIESDYGAVGEYYANNSETDNISTDFSANLLTLIDISTILTSLVADDYVGIQLTETGVSFLGLRFKYT